jgi:site-specific DNA-methyltransferase (adenine-specific)
MSRETELGGAAANATESVRGEEPVLVHGDALRTLIEIPNDCVDLVLADPPYSSGGAFRGDRTQQTARSKYASSASMAAALLDDFSGDNRDQRSYLAWSTLWMGEARRVLRVGRAIAVFTDWRQLPTTTDALQAAGFVWRGVAVWDKMAGRPSPGISNGAAEYIVWGTNGPTNLGTDVYLPNIIRAKVPRKERLHITPKPIELLGHLVQLAPPQGIVLDPFCGSGSVAVAAKNHGRRSISAEITAEYIDVARHRLAGEVMQLTLGESEAA